MSPASDRPPVHTDRPEGDAWAEQIYRMETSELRLLALTLPVIEQAKGIVMGHYGCGPTTAFTMLRRWSSAYNIKLRDLAAALVDEASAESSRGDGQPSGSLERFLHTRELG